jgi:hypothetical protein
VRVSEAACPFCGAVLGDELRAAAAPQAPSARLSRAALFALGTSTAAALGCSDGPGFIEPAYGAPAFALDASTDGPGISEPAYGAPVFPVDASHDGPGLGEPAYGATPTPVELDAGGDAPND